MQATVPATGKKGGYRGPENGEDFKNLHLLR